MANRFVLAAVGLVYAASAVWLVHAQGRAYRDSLRERRAALVARVVPTNPAQRQIDAIPEPAPPTPHIIDKRVPIPTDEVRPPEPTPAKPYESTVALRPLVIAGLETASTAEEAMFGEALSALIAINHPTLPEGSAQQRTILEAIEPLMDLRERKDVEIKLNILDSDDVNAFSHMGGYVYVSRGTLSFAGSDEEFQFAVGHELAHIDLRHGRAQLARLTRDGTVAKVGTVQAVYHQIAEGYTEAEEFAADDWATDRMVKLDHTTRECLMYLRKLRRLSEEQGFREGRKPAKTPPEAATQDVGNHARSAPAAWKRLARLEARFNVKPARPSAPASAP